MSEGPFQAEPFEEILEKFRHRVITKGGSVEEHYALRSIDKLTQKLAEVKEAIAKAREDGARDMRQRIIKAMNVFAEQKSIDGKAMAALLEGVFSTLPLTEEGK